MTTKLTVNPETNGTLKQNKNLSSRIMRFTASLLLSGLALGAMSFTQEDTTKKEEQQSVTMQSTSTVDTCCTVTFVNGIQNIVITNRNAFSADVRINNMDINTWVNSMMAYSFKNININSIGLADNKIDLVFTKVELINRRMAVAFGKNLKNETLDADVELNETFNTTVAAPLFGKMLNAETIDADAIMDKTMNDDAENRVKAAQFSKAIGFEKANADDEMDFMVNASVLKNISPVVGLNADQQMDELIYKSGISKIRPATAKDADKGMDELLRNKN